MRTEILTEDQTTRLLCNGASEADDDPLPVVKLIARKAGYIWLLCALDPDEPSIAFTLCDFGNGSPYHDYLDLDELPTLEMDIAEPVEIDPSFQPLHPISVYHHAAKTHGKIVEDADALETAASDLLAHKIRQAHVALARHKGGICQPPRGYELIAPPLPKGLLTKRQMQRLLANGSAEKAGQDHRPVVRLFLPAVRCVWLLTELDRSSLQSPSFLWTTAKAVQCSTASTWPMWLTMPQRSSGR